MAEIVRILRQRHLLSDITTTKLSGLLQCNRAVPAVYCGFDPTAPSLHLGNLIQVLVLKQFQQLGMRPIVLVGGATGMIGDPSGKSEERILLDEETVQYNITNFQQSLTKVLDFDCPERGAKVVNNMDWHGKLTAMEWLRDAGQYFRVSAMLGKESVKRRMESTQGISFLEFSYQLFQAYDFLHLYQHENCKVQIGGTDQWGNITCGVELIRKAVGGEAAGVTIPLLTTQAGEKYGKSAGNAIWLDATMTSEYEFYQYFMRTDDADVRQLLQTFTLKPMEEIDAICEEHKKETSKRYAQKMLAASVTKLIHGETGLRKAEQASSILFGGSIEGLAAADILSIASEVPYVKFPISSVLERRLVDVVVEANICKSKAEYRRLISAGGLYLNNVRITNVQHVIESSNIIDEKVMLLRTGRKHYHIIRIE